MFKYMTVVFCVFSVILTAILAQKKPNIIFVLTDDQDVFLNGEEPISKIRHLIGEQGIVFKNMFVTSPLCCPSRSSILTGNYVHNHGAVNNSLNGNCSSPSWQQGSEKRTFAPYLQTLGYRTFYAGKYLNKYGSKLAGGFKHIPPGWTNWYGLVGNSRYYNYTVSNNGKKEVHRDNPQTDYFTTQISLKAMDFLQSHVSSNQSDPFFMMLATPACHSPFTPELRYQNNFTGIKAPRDKSFNVYSKDKHWLMRQVKHPMGQESLQTIEQTFVNRWRTLLTVDDMVEDIVNFLTKHNLLSETYIFFASDNGYHLGQFSLPQDKRQLYEFDIRVPLMVRGPGISPGQSRQDIVLNLDFAPTFIDLAGSSALPQMDGQSIKPLLHSTVNASVPNWRDHFLVEHSGEYQNLNPGCPQWDNQTVSNCFPDCVCEDAYNNTYLCVRSINDKLNLMYCEFQDQENFIEVYDLNSDPYQLTNLAHNFDPKVLVHQNQRLVSLAICRGTECKQKEISILPSQA